MSRTTRLLELIDILKTRRLAVTATDLAQLLDVSPRSIYRDIETLRSLGAPIDGQAGVGYCLRDGFFLPSLTFTQNELDVLILGLNWVRDQTDAKLAKSSDTALAKILAATNQSDSSSAAPTLIAATSRSEHNASVSVLRDAIGCQQKVAIRYADRFGQLSERVIWPIAIVFFNNVHVLAAWCEQRAAYRHFRVDRISVEQVLDERYQGRRQTLFAQWRKQDSDWSPESKARECSRDG